MFQINDDKVRFIMCAHISRWTFALSLVLCQISSYGFCKSEPINNLLLFGDSYFDTGAGNAVAASVGVPPPSPAPFYFNNRHSNGPIWIDYTSQNLGLPVVDYAVAGSETGLGNVNTNALGGLFQQVQRFQATGQTISPHTLVILDGAGNDFLALTGSISTLNPAAAAAAGAQALQNLAVVFTELEKLGAQKIVVWNLGDLGKLPLFNQNPASVPFGPLAAAQPLFTGASLGYNAALPGVITKLNSEAFHFVNGLSNEQQIFIFDAYTAFNELAAELTAQGINLSQFALVSIYPSTYVFTGQDPANLAFYDQVHPTTYAWGLFSAITSAYIDTIIDGPRFIASQLDFAFETSKAHRDVVENHFRTLNVERYIYERCCCDNYCDCCCGQNCFQGYVDGEGKWGSTPNKDGNLGFNYETGLGLVGLDFRVSQNLTLGASFTYQRSHARINNGRGSMNLNDYVPTIYAAYFGPCFFINMASSYHYSTFRNIKRNIPFVDAVAKGSCDAQAGEWNLEAGYVTQYGCFTMIPILGIDVATISIRGYTEQDAGFLNLKSNRLHQRSCVAKVGAQLFWDGFNGCFVPFGEVAYEHEFLRNGRLMGPRFADSLDGAKIYNHTSAPNRDVIKYSVGLEAKLNSCIVGNVSYVGDTNFREYNNAVRAQIDFAF